MKQQEVVDNFDSVIKMIFKRLVHNFNKESDLTMEQFVLLNIINDHPDINQNELAQIACKDKSAVVRQVDVLEKKNTVKRQTCLLDRRKNKMKITEYGLEILEKGNAFKKEFFDQILDVLEPKEREDFNVILLKLMKSLSE